MRLANIHARRSQASKRNIRRFNAHYVEREREHNVLDIHALVSATDRYGRITYVNDNFCRTSGYASQELLGKNHRIIKSGIHDASFYQEIWRTIASGGVWSGEICNKRKDGSFYWVDSTIAAFLDDQGEVYQYLSIRKDITHRNNAEKQLRQTIDMLEHAKEAAETANLAKTQFLSQMSHELRTPLNAILGFAQILKDSTSLTEDEMLDVSEIYKAGTHLLNLINEMLDLSAVESGRLKFIYDAVNIRDIVKECCQLLSPLALEHHIQIDYAIDEAQAVKVDKSRLKQVLLNLLSNAVKYNKEGGQVCISTYPADDYMLRIRIDDTGRGLSPEQISQLFKPFNRLGKEKENIEGTGIGLTLSKSLTELMGGKIGVESCLGEGSVFWLDFPRADSTISKNRLEHERIDTEKGQVFALFEPEQQKTILYVEDNLSNLRLVEQILASREHVRLLTALSPQTAIEMAFDQPVDLVLMDINLPEMSGFDLMALLSREPAFKHVPFVAISADATKENIEKGRVSGFIDYLTKPINIKLFNAMIDKHLA